MSHAKRTSNAQLRDIVFRASSTLHGSGLFARRAIKKGEYIGTYWGPTAKRNGTYVLWVYEQDGGAVGRSGRNLLRYLNHSTQGNAEFDGFDLFAAKRIRAGDEITFDYMESDFG